MSNCNHFDDNGKPTIVFETKKWIGIYPKKIKGFCTLCKKTVDFTENEYREYVKEGDMC